MKIAIMTLFPEMVDGILAESILGRAQKNGLLEIRSYNIRDYTLDKHRHVDDYCYSGGAGMLMQAEPIWRCYQQVLADFGIEDQEGMDGVPVKVLYMSPQGEVFRQSTAVELSEEECLIFLCGHYEGVDERALELLHARPVSIGDYVLTGGELPAMVLIDTVARFLDGVLASEESVLDESVYSGLLEYPQYSKPREYEGMGVPEVLLSGNHKEIARWRWEQSLELTAERRPDLMKEYLDKPHEELTRKERAVLDKYR